MAAMQPTRRGLLGAITAVPFVIATPATAMPFTGDFTLRLAEYRAARDHFLQICEGANDAPTAAACAESDEAFQALLESPCLNAHHLAEKLEAYDVEYADSDFDTDRFRMIVADARRLAAH